MTNPWFKDNRCTALEVKKYKSSGVRTVVQAVQIDDREFLGKLVGRIESLPVDGEEMIKMGPTASLVELVFTCTGGPTTIEIYAHKFKTPSTGFISGKNEIEHQLDLDLETILAPGLGKLMPKIKGLEYKFKNFTVTYGGATVFDGAPATVSATREVFVLRGKDRREHNVEVSHGQVPPAPQKVTVGAVKLTLLTYRTKQRQDLFPNYFQITK